MNVHNSIYMYRKNQKNLNAPQNISIIILNFEHCEFTKTLCIQKMQTAK